MTTLVDFICPICGNRWGDFDACPHSTLDMLEWQAAEIERLNKALDEISTIGNVGENWLDVVLEMKSIARTAREVQK